MTNYTMKKTLETLDKAITALETDGQHSEILNRAPAIASVMRQVNINQAQNRELVDQKRLIRIVLYDRYITAKHLLQFAEEASKTEEEKKEMQELMRKSTQQMKLCKKKATKMNVDLDKPPFYIEELLELIDSI